jgi:1-acyl-sn-glycerol-3-phosphate acyltransferase
MEFTLPHIPDSYLSPPEIRRVVSCMFPTLTYYWRMCMIVGKGGGKAKQGLYPAAAWIESSLGIFRAMEYCGTVFEISGLEHIKNTPGPCVIVSNHMSTLETFVLPCLIQPHKDVTFVVKDSLLRYPRFGQVLASRDPVIVGRKDARADLAAVLDGGVERLKKGRSIIVFPQSTRSFTMDERKFNSIGVKLAKKAGTPVIPLALRTDAWANGKIVKDFGPIKPERGARFKFGPPLDIVGNGKNEHAQIVKFIQENLKAWGVE